MRKYIRWAGVAAGFVTFLWAYGITKGDILQSLNFALKVILLYVVVDVVWLKPKQERETSGLSEEQWMLKKVGGLAELRKKSKSDRIAAWFFLIAPFVIFLFSAAVSTFGAGLLFGGIVGIITFPCSVSLFWSLRKTAKIKEESTSVK
jgi:hypothetical protein